MSAVNWSELAAKLTQHGAPVQRTLDRLSAFGMRVLPFTSDMAVAAGLLWEETPSVCLPGTGPVWPPRAPLPTPLSIPAILPGPICR